MIELIFSYTVFFQASIKTLNFNDSTDIFCFLIGHVSMMFLSLTLYVQIAPTYFSGTFSFFQTLLITDLMHRTEKYQLNDASNFYVYRRIFLRSIQLLLFINRIIGFLITLVVAIYSPMHAFICIHLFFNHSRMSPYITFFYFFLFSFQIMYTFILHYKLAQLFPLVWRLA